MSEPRGLLADVVRFSNVDGPGNRFVAFLQGCNFDCIACHNPYTINVCNHCGECVAGCPSGALSVDGGLVRWAADVCTGSDHCITVCPFDSTPKARSVSVGDLVAQVRRVAPFLSGVTVSGGEATLQHEFVRAWFAALKGSADPRLARLTTFVDSNGAAGPDVWEALAPVMDGAMIDLKCLDPEVHLEMTGQPNDEVVRSIEVLAGMGRLYEVRLLVLPGVNDAPALLAETGAWLRSVDPAMRIKVIGFRCHGVRPSVRELREPTPDEMVAYERIVRDAGFTDVCVV